MKEKKYKYVKGSVSVSELTGQKLYILKADWKGIEVLIAWPDGGKIPAVAVNGETPEKIVPPEIYKEIVEESRQAVEEAKNESENQSDPR